MFTQTWPRTGLILIPVLDGNGAVGELPTVPVPLASKTEQYTAVSEPCFDLTNLGSFESVKGNVVEVDDAYERMRIL